MKSRNAEVKSISSTDAAQFEALWPLLSAMRNEYSELSKKKPDGTLNKLKVHSVNRLLTDLKELLKNENIIRYLDLLSDDDLPQYSDVTITLSQYVAAMTSFKEARQYQDANYTIVWYISK
jgi:hypothetical protein